MAIEPCPAMRASVHASHPLSPSRVTNVCRRLYSTNGRTLACLSAIRCRRLRLHGSTWPLLANAGQTQPSSGRPALSHRASKTALTRGVNGSTRRAAFVFPCVTNKVPLRRCYANYAESRTTVQDLLLMSFHQIVVWHDEQIARESTVRCKPGLTLAFGGGQTYFVGQRGLDNGNFGLLQGAHSWRKLQGLVRHS
jgi:hypothetical protein